MEHTEWNVHFTKDKTMCLNIADGMTVETSNEPVIVFKVLDKRRHKRATTFSSPYFEMPYTRGDTKEVESFGMRYFDGSHDMHLINFNGWIPEGRQRRVEQGLHAYIHAERADLFSRCDPDQIVVRCIIPRGTPFIRGVNDIVTLKLQVGKAIRGARHLVDAFNYPNGPVPKEFDND